jgi:phage shock protein E
MFFGLVFILVIVGVLYVFTSRQTDEITPSEARKNIQKGKYDFIVDVRTDKEWDEGHLPNTIHIPIGSLVQELPQKIPNTNARILFVCKKGIRASGVVTIAHKMGYKNVQAMIGNYKELSS